MILDKKISLVLPCYNEEDGLRLIFKNDLSLIDEIIVADNNSADNTAAVAKSFNCVVVKEERPGYGSAYQTGFKTARGDIIIAMDGDGTYSTEAIPRLIAKMIREDIDFISGNRLAAGKPKSMPFINYAGNVFFSLLVRWLFIKNINDSWSGMWIFKREILNKINLREEGMAFSQEIKIATVAHGFKLVEVPINYYSRAGKVKLRRFKDGFYALMFLFKTKLKLK